MNVLKIKFLSESATCPSRANITDAGLDLCAAEDLVIMGQSRAMIKTDLAFEIPEGYYGRVAPRSGLALKNGIDVFAGVVDSSYRGPINVILYNSDKADFQLSKGDRIAQIIIEKHYNFPLEIVNDLSDTNRGSGGFGSTGIK
jgi:dUTP pyrophosphatase